MEADRKGRRTSWSPPADHKLESLTPSSGEELEQSLSAAELLLREALAERRHAQNRRAGAIALLLTVVSSLGVLLAVMQSAGFGRGIGALLTLLGASALVPLARFLLVRSTEPESSRLRVALQLAAMIGDVFPEIARRERWSYFRVEATRLRLSAFPLDPRRAERTVGSERREDVGKS